MPEPLSLEQIAGQGGAGSYAVERVLARELIALRDISDQRYDALHALYRRLSPNWPDSLESPDAEPDAALEQRVENAERDARLWQTTSEQMSVERGIACDERDEAVAAVERLRQIVSLHLVERGGVIDADWLLGQFPATADALKEATDG